jgi:tRNA(Arg) A34 adenosine deaminase TadA
MLLAIAEARKNLKSLAGGPFGAVIVKNNKVIAVARNTVLSENDATCHAEVNAIRKASFKLQDYYLSGCVIYSTTEPCPMCFSAIHWAKIEAIYFGTAINDVKKLGFDELRLSCKKMKSAGKSRVKVVSGFLTGECLKLLKAWNKLENKKVY